MKSRELTVVLACSASLGACMAGGQAARNPGAEKEVSEALEGRVAGMPERCINNDSSVQVEVIDERTILYRDGRILYVQHPRDGCPGLGGGAYTLVARPFGSQLCDGDIINLADLRTGMGGPTCVFGPFIPYTRPAS